MLDLGIAGVKMVQCEPIGYRSKEFCLECNRDTPHRLIAYNKQNDPVFECALCGHMFFDDINGDYNE
jgi:hypothetical protein